MDYQYLYSGSKIETFLKRLNNLNSSFWTNCHCNLTYIYRLKINRGLTNYPLIARSGYEEMCLDMKFNFARPFWNIFTSFVCTSETRAQQSSDSILYTQSARNIHQVYINEIGDNAQIYHGIELSAMARKRTDSHILKVDSLLVGSVSYQGVIYPESELLSTIWYRTNSLSINFSNITRSLPLQPKKLIPFPFGNHVFYPSDFR